MSELQQRVSKRLDDLAHGEFSAASELVGQARDLHKRDPKARDILLRAQKHLNLAEILDRASFEALHEENRVQRKKKKKVVEPVEVVTPTLVH